MSQSAPAEWDDDTISDEMVALERRIDDLMAQLRAVLPPEHFRLVWELRDAEEALSYARHFDRHRPPRTALAPQPQ